MNRIAKISALAAFCALSFGGISQAANGAMNWPTEIDSSVRSFKGGNFDVVNIASLNKMSETHTWIDQATPDQVAALQSAVDANRPLAEKLKAENVEINNIIGAEQAADGSLTFYIR